MAVAGLMFATASNAQLQDEKNVTITMDLQPILQLDMSTPDQIDFVFDDISDYYGGITKYGATILKVSSTVNWDLYAVGTSNDGSFWDVQMNYGGANDGVTTLPLELLELHQNYPNQTAAAALPSAPGLWYDYSANFTDATAYVQGQNNIFPSASPYTAPAASDKYVQGHAGLTEFIGGGSYFLQGSGTLTEFYNVIDYRIVPGLPAIFPTAGLNDGTPRDLVSIGAAGDYARPGVYTMNVKYVLLENQ